MPDLEPLCPGCHSDGSCDYERDAAPDPTPEPLTPERRVIVDGGPTYGSVWVAVDGRQASVVVGADFGRCLQLADVLRAALAAAEWAAAERMRAACIALCEHETTDELADAIRALPLP